MQSARSTAETVTDQIGDADEENECIAEELVAVNNNLELSKHTEHFEENIVSIQNIDATEDNVLCGTCFRKLQNIDDECVLCERNKITAVKRKDAFLNLETQAAKMKKISDHKFAPADVGTTVRIPVPEVDRGRGDARSILGVILANNDGFYRIGTRDGTLKNLLVRSQFDVCKENIINISEVGSKEVGIRTLATSQSLGSGQGFKKCACKNKCQSKKCNCVKNNVLCNSKCHNSLSCCNK